MEIDDKVKEYTEYLYKMIEPFLEDVGYEKDIKHIIFKTLKVFYAETKKL
jgi:hypothetical protein